MGAGSGSSFQVDWMSVSFVNKTVPAEGVFLLQRMRIWGKMCDQIPPQGGKIIG